MFNRDIFLHLVHFVSFLGAPDNTSASSTYCIFLEFITPIPTFLFPVSAAIGTLQDACNINFICPYISCLLSKPHMGTIPAVSDPLCYCLQLWSSLYNLILFRYTLNGCEQLCNYSEPIPVLLLQLSGYVFGKSLYEGFSLLVPAYIFPIVCMFLTDLLSNIHDLFTCLSVLRTLSSFSRVLVLSFYVLSIHAILKILLQHISKASLIFILFCFMVYRAKEIATQHSKAQSLIQVATALSFC